MELYLTNKEILKYPIDKKYKKTTYGGAKVFIKKKLLDKNNNPVILEFTCCRGKWTIEKEERLKAYKLNIDSKNISKLIRKLNKTQIKKAIDLNLNFDEYKTIYSNYSDTEKLGYYKTNSPEYIRVKDILSNIKDNSLVYDIGCNSGGIGNLLIKTKKCSVFGSEICPNLAKKAESKKIVVHNGFAESNPFKSNSFDYVIAAFILEHVINPQKVISETFRVLKNGGILIGQVPTEFGDWGKKTIGKHPEHLRAYNKEELKNLLEQFNFKIIFIKKRKLIGRRISDYYFFKAKK